jgi:light-regulated signal transduction histidine kinase (bacteriophytochrome)
MAQSRIFIMRIVATALILLAAMTAFETTKQIVFPHITIWQSHIVTIVFASVTGTILSYCVFRRLDELYIEMEQRVETRTAELEASNRQLASFSYTVAHDLRAPLRAINGFSAMVLQASESTLDPTSVGHLKRVIAGSERMGALIDCLLDLTRVTQQKLRWQDFNLSELAAAVAASLAGAQPQRNVAVAIRPGMRAHGDFGLMQVVLENLIGNAWKFTANTGAASIGVGAEPRDGKTVYFVRDNGAGFNMDYAHKLFAPFQRLHQTHEFEGAGIGLATVKNIIQRHGGNIWAESAVDAGTTMFFTLGPESNIER